MTLRSTVLFNLNIRSHFTYNTIIIIILVVRTYLTEYKKFKKNVWSPSDSQHDGLYYISTL